MLHFRCGGAGGAESKANRLDGEGGGSSRYAFLYYAVG